MPTVGCWGWSVPGRSGGQCPWCGGGSVPTVPTGAGPLTNTAGLQKLSDIIQVGRATPMTSVASFLQAVGVLPPPAAVVLESRLGGGAEVPAPRASGQRPSGLP